MALPDCALVRRPATQDSGHADMGPVHADDGACIVPHTRSYVHHLLLDKEIMGKAFLDAHNWYHMRRFMREVRARVVDGSLASFAEAFRARYTAASFQPPAPPSAADNQSESNESKQ